MDGKIYHIDKREKKEELEREVVTVRKIFSNFQ